MVKATSVRGNTPQIKIDLFSAAPAKVKTRRAEFLITSRLRDGDRFESIITAEDDTGLITTDTILWDGNNHHNQLQLGDDYYDLRIEIENGRPQLYITYIL